MNAFCSKLQPGIFLLVVSGVFHSVGKNNLETGPSNSQDFLG